MTAVVRIWSSDGARPTHLPTPPGTETLRQRRSRRRLLTPTESPHTKVCIDLRLCTGRAEPLGTIQRLCYHPPQVAGAYGRDCRPDLEPRPDTLQSAEDENNARESVVEVVYLILGCGGKVAAQAPPPVCMEETDKEPLAVVVRAVVWAAPAGARSGFKSTRTTTWRPLSIPRGRIRTSSTQGSRCSAAPRIRTSGIHGPTFSAMVCRQL